MTSVRTVTTLLLAVALTAAPVPSAVAAPPGSVTYAADPADIANPDRGLFHFTETHFRADGTGAAPLDVDTLTGWRVTEHLSLAFRIYYLEKYADADQIAPADLAFIAADLAAARTAGMRLIVRFAYTDADAHDAPPARVIGHIEQLGPVLSAAADTIAVLQAGFVGRWGEWYYTEHFVTDPSQPGEVTDADWTARGSVLDALLDATPSTVFLQVRTPQIRRVLLTGDPRAARVGVHDDCFLASSDDNGTFPTPADRLELAASSRTTPVGGETCGVNPPRSDWPTARAELTTFRWSFLNQDFAADVLGSWGTAGLAEARHRLGYRLRLVSARLTPAARRGGPVSLRLTIANDGFAAPYRSRPVRLVLRGSHASITVPLPVDVRALAPRKTAVFFLTVSAPAVADTYAAALALPDPSPRLAANPAYAIRLANLDTWSPGTGENALNLSLTVT